jgi:hypothetical protein
MSSLHHLGLQHCVREKERGSYGEKSREREKRESKTQGRKK